MAGIIDASSFLLKIEQVENIEKRNLDLKRWNVGN